MKDSYEEGFANRFGLGQRGGAGNRTVLSVCIEEHAGQLLSSEIIISACRSCPDLEKATSLLASWRAGSERGGVYDPVHAWIFPTREPGGPASFLNDGHDVAAERNHHLDRDDDGHGS